jgi:hypothetical protein
MEEAVRFAKAAEWPLPSQAFDDVQDIGAQKWQRQ